MNKILFLDRDGTLVGEPPDEQVDRLDKIELLNGVLPALMRLTADGYRLVMVSNQDGLGTSAYPQEAFDSVQAFLLRLFASQGIRFDDILVCPHTAAMGCSCRKPAVGLLTHYLTSSSWDRSRSFVIGDRDTDLKLADNLGIRGLKVANTIHKDALSWRAIADTILAEPRRAKIKRATRETSIMVEVDLDHPDPVTITTGLAFFDHMLEQLALHSGISMQIDAKGDLHVDEHHLIEDTALAIGEAITQALSDKYNIGRYGFVLPMDEAEAQVALDLCGRTHFIFNGSFSREKVGEMPTEMIAHFFAALAGALKMNLHISVSGDNCHHKVEAIFKAVARSLGQAVHKQGSAGGLPSTKGIL